MELVLTALTGMCVLHTAVNNGMFRKHLREYSRATVIANKHMCREIQSKVVAGPVSGAAMSPLLQPRCPTCR